MNELQIFNNPEFGDMRIIELNGEPWFVGKDVATALGYAEPTKAVRERVDSEDRGVSKIDTPSGAQEMTIINESGLYSLVLSSKLPSAKKFKRWVTSEVLPALRKHGSYQGRPKSSAEMFYAQAQINMEVEQRMTELEQANRDVTRKFSETVALFSLPAVSKDDWQAEMNRAINRLCEGYGLNHQTTRGDMYAELENEIGCNLTARQSRLRERLRRNGATAKEANAVTKLTVIAQDAKLRAAFEGIVRRWTAQRLA